MLSRAARFLEDRLGVFIRRRSQLWAGCDLFVDLDRIIGLRNIRSVFDVGANRGATCEKFRRQFPKAVIHAFEPVSENFEALRDRVGGFENIHLYPLALSDTPGRRVIHLNELHTHHSLEYGGGGSSESIVATTLDLFCAEHGVECIDFLKIDAEGHDLAVLRGAAGMLERGAIRELLVESTLRAGDPRYVPLSTFQEMLEVHGFRLHSLHEQCLREKSELIFFNALFVHCDPSSSVAN